VATLGLAVVVTFFAGGGHPVTAGWWISICHPVQAASRGDIVVRENRAISRAMAVVYIVSLMKASIVQRLSNRSCCFKGNPEI
jgi:membrane-associated PAP2 superfamily phosphatase